MTAFTVAPPVRALIRKELREYRQHRMIVLTATILPIVFLVLPMANSRSSIPTRPSAASTLPSARRCFASS